MKKIACVKFAGLASGGTEKYLQTLAIILAKNNYNVDYFYTNVAQLKSVHPDNDDDRKKLVESYNINTIPVHLDRHGDLEWTNTNFWELFKEDRYDFVQTARGGYEEYPFNVMNNCSIIDSIHGFLAFDKPNIKKAILLCNWQADKWISNGGNSKKVEIIPSIVEVPKKKESNLRKLLNIQEKFVYGFHQATRSDIFSNISLLAYSKIQDDDTCFVILGGSQLYVDLAKQLNLKNVYFLDFTSCVEDIHEFLAGIDVFAHARSDGEVCSASIIEAMYHGKPVISHPALNMGHLEQIEDCGKMAYSVEEYAQEMKKLKDDKDYYAEKSEKTLIKYNEKYDFKKIESNIIHLYDNLNY